MLLSDVSIKRPVFATMMMVALVVLGVVSYKRLAIDEYPDITYPVVVAQTTYPGASPEVMMREISKPIEEALNTVQGIKEITSTSLEALARAPARNPGSPRQPHRARRHRAPRARHGPHHRSSRVLRHPRRRAQRHPDSHRRRGHRGRRRR